MIRKKPVPDPIRDGYRFSEKTIGWPPQFAGTETKQRAALIVVKKKIETAMTSYAQEYHKKLPRVQTDAGSTALAALKGAAA
jgi:hypothetical protein